MSGMLGRLFGRPSEADGDLDYDRAREMARHPDAAVRRRLAKRGDARPELLYYLADDSAPEVRREIAANEATPPHAYKSLAHDVDEDVRCDLARKIARLTPGLTSDERDKIRELTLEALEILASDEIVRVRQVIAETLKDVADVPRYIIQRLARDSELAVAAPVLEFSPLLTDDGLVEIIESSAVVGALSAISRRGDLSEIVSDVIADSDDQDAVAALLANPSAQIREETLDQLVDGARRVERWQMPIALRPRLPLKAARKLAGFVADAVLGALMRRDDLDEDTAALVSETVHKRMREGLAGDARDGEGDLSACPDQAKGGKPKRVGDEVRRLHKEGKLDDARISVELTSGNRAFVTHALAIKSGLTSSVIGRIGAARSAKGVTSLAWKAGFSMRFAIKLQARFGNVPPGEILQARDGFDFPMSEEDMNWQLDFYAS
jgi:uncharacterized protein (DUF2336 family)